MYRSAALVALVPPVAVTRISTVPVPAGAVAVISVAFWATTLAAVLPKVTAVTPEKLEPVMVTLVPPPVVPEAGETLLMVGAGI